MSEGINYHIEAHRIINVVFKDENPPLRLNAMRYDDTTYEFTLSLKDFKLIEGKQHLYLFDDLILYRLDSEYSTHLMPLLKLFASIKRGLLVDVRHMPSFYNNVLTSVNSLIVLSGDDISRCV